MRLHQVEGPSAQVNPRTISCEIADCSHCWQNASMTVQITIRDVPDEVRDELAARAALEGKSMQEFLRQALVQMADKPSVEVWLSEVRQRKAASGTRLSTAKILGARKAEKR